jgi:hypothetical protein
VEIRLQDAQPGSGQAEIRLPGARKGILHYGRAFPELSDVIALFLNWHNWGELPDLSQWEDVEASFPMSDQKAARTNNRMKLWIVLVAAVIVIGGVAYIVSGFIG